MVDLVQDCLTDEPIMGAMDEEEAMIKKRLGFVPTSVWYFTKTKSFQRFIDDELAIGSYASDSGQRALSQFNPVVAEKIIKIWSREGDKILDPFSGRCRALMAQFLNRDYVGYEISQLAAKKMLERVDRNTLFEYDDSIQFKRTPQIINDDCRNMAYENKFDLVFSCPPYWNVEDYNDIYGENNEGQLGSIKKYEDFLAEYEKIIPKLYGALKEGKFCVWVVADMRRDKTLIPFGADTIKLFLKHGFKLNDVVINQLNTPAVTGVGTAINYGYCPKAHEYILVFRKGENYGFDAKEGD
jgi:DNA modification methylase